MSEMFDSATGQIPAGAQVILLPTDGIYAANNAAVKAKFPQASYQTYSAVGQVAGEWIDVEVGCVWPPSAAVPLWRQWRPDCRGFYCAKSTKPLLVALLGAGENPEWFEADPTGTPHVLAGDAQTQWGWFGTYDETEIPVPPPPPPSPLPSTEGDDVEVITCTGQPDYLAMGGVVSQITQPQDVQSLVAEGASLRRLDALTPALRDSVLAKLKAKAAEA